MVNRKKRPRVKIRPWESTESRALEHLTLIKMKIESKKIVGLKSGRNHRRLSRRELAYTRIAIIPSRNSFRVPPADAITITRILPRWAPCVLSTAISVLPATISDWKVIQNSNFAHVRLRIFNADTAFKFCLLQIRFWVLIESARVQNSTHCLEGDKCSPPNWTK